MIKALLVGVVAVFTITYSVAASGVSCGNCESECYPSVHSESVSVIHTTGNKNCSAPVYGGCGLIQHIYFLSNNKLDFSARGQIGTYSKGLKFILPCGVIGCAKSSNASAMYVERRRLASIGQCESGFEFTLFNSSAPASYSDISPQLSLGGILSDVDRGPSRFQSSVDKEDTEASRQHLGKPYPEHPISPFGHILLGSQVVGSVLFFFGCLWFGYRSFECAGDALDIVLNGDNWGWFRVVFLLRLFFVSVGLASGIVTYWISVCASC